MTALSPSVRLKELLGRCAFWFWTFLARLGFFRYEGSWNFAPEWWPKAKVRYPTGHISATMAIGNALDYQRIYGGELLPPNAHNKRHADTLTTENET